MISLTEFLDFYGPAHGITSRRYLQQCCAGWVMPSGHKCKLPDGWRAAKVEGRWYLEKTRHRGRV